LISSAGYVIFVEFLFRTDLHYDTEWLGLQRFKTSIFKLPTADFQCFGINPPEVLNTACLNKYLELIDESSEDSR
jgi:hypothetical protein